MKIRELILSDIPSLTSLAQKTYINTFAHTMTKDELQDALNSRSESYFRSIMNKDTVLVALDRDTLVGFIQFGKVDYDSVKATDKNIKLDKIYVDGKYQGKGIGKKLMEAMLKHKRLATINHIYLDVFAENEKATRLYEQYGFRVVGKTPFKIKGKVVGYDLLMKK
ncbi:MAG: GNAT family N-acetyltransferase [Candidatus Roizmanbacteria bacterium]|nr:GNAT family N-acetyltransferase [Candidatus Roizmanbacteria bacterium]